MEELEGEYNNVEPYIEKEIVEKKDLPNNEPSVSKNVFIGVIGTILLKVISFVTIILVGYVMTDQEYGNLSTFNTWITIFSVFIGFQFGGSLQNALLEYDRKKYHSYCASLIVFATVMFLVVCIPSFIFKQSLSEFLKVDSIFMYILLPQCFFSFLVNFMSTYFLSQKMVKKNLIWTLVFCVSVAFFSILFAVIIDYKEFGYSLGVFIPNAVMGTISLIYFMVKSKLKFDLKYLKFALLFSLPLVMHMLGSVILGQSDKIMIRFMMNESQTGQYTMTHNYAMLLNSVWVAFNGVFIPYYYDNLKNNKMDVLKSQSKNYYILFTSVSLSFILVGREIVRFIINEKFYDGLSIFELSVLAQYFIFLYSFSVNYEFYKKKTVWIAVGTIITAGINILLNYFFINLWGIFGAALASAISYCFLIMFHELIARVVIKGYQLSILYTIILVLASSFITVAAIFLRDYWYIRWVIGICIMIFIIFRVIKMKKLI